MIRRTLRDAIPGRYEISTGFVMHPVAAQPLRSRQIDVLVWDALEHAPIFRDGDVVVIPPQALRIAIEVKSTLDGSVLRDAMKNLDSLTPFLDVLLHHVDRQDNGSRARGFRRFVVAGGTRDLAFPEGFFRHVRRYYEEADEAAAKAVPPDVVPDWTTDQRLQHSRLSELFGMSSWINGIAALGAGMIRASTLGDNAGYFVSNDVAAGEPDRTIGQIHQAIGLFLTNDLRLAMKQDGMLTPRELAGVVLTFPPDAPIPKGLPAKRFEPSKG